MRKACERPARGAAALAWLLAFAACARPAPGPDSPPFARGGIAPLDAPLGSGEGAAALTPSPGAPVLTPADPRPEVDASVLARCVDGQRAALACRPSPRAPAKAFVVEEVVEGDDVAAPAGREPFCRAGGTADSPLPADVAARIEGAIAGRAKAFHSCYRRALRANPDAEGGVLLRFTVHPDGALRGAAAVADSVGAGAGECLARALSATRIEQGAPQVGTATYVLSLRFCPMR